MTCVSRPEDFHKDRDDSAEYASILEGSPMKKQEVYHDALLSLMAEMFLDHTRRTFRMKELYQKIDAALESGDEESFLYLTKELRELKEAECS